MQTGLLALAQKSPESLKEFKFHSLTATSVASNGTITVWFNDQMIHSPPLGLSLVHNAFIQSFVCKDCNILVTNAPLPFRSEPDASDVDIYELFMEMAFEILFPIFVYIVMSILAAKLTSFYIEVCIVL